MASSGSGKRKRVNLSLAQKLELIRKVDAGVPVARVCDEYGVKKQTVSDIRKSKEKLTQFALKYSVDGSVCGSGTVSGRKHMKVAKDKDIEDAVYKWYVQQRSCGVNVRGVDLAGAANKLADHMKIPFKASEGWLWRFRNRHGIRDKTLHGEAGSAVAENVEPFRLQLNELIRKEGLDLSQVYNADETGLFWRALPRNTQAFIHEERTPGRKLNKERFSALCCANANGNHRHKLVIVGKAARPRVLKDCMRQLPVIYYNSKNAWFTAAIFTDWFFKHFVPEVRRHQEDVLNVVPEDVKALLLLDNAPAHPSAEKLVSHDGKIRVMFLPPNTTSLIQPMDQGVIVACKRIYQRRYMDEVMVVLEDDEDIESDSRGQRTLHNIKNYNIKSAIFNFAASWKDVKITTLANSWKRLLRNVDPEINFEGFEARDFHRVLLRAGERNVQLEDIDSWLKESEDDPGYQIMTTEEIAEEVQVPAGNKDESSDEEELPVKKPKMSTLRDSIDNLLIYIDVSHNPEVQGYYGHLRTLREIIIKEQYQHGKQLKIDSFFKSPAAGATGATAAATGAPIASTSGTAATPSSSKQSQSLELDSSSDSDSD